MVFLTADSFEVYFQDCEIVPVKEVKMEKKFRVGQKVKVVDEGEVVKVNQVFWDNHPEISKEMYDTNYNPCKGTIWVYFGRVTSNDNVVHIIGDGGGLIFITELGIAGIHDRIDSLEAFVNVHCDFECQQENVKAICREIDKRFEELK